MKILKALEEKLSSKFILRLYVGSFLGFMILVWALFMASLLGIESNIQVIILKLALTFSLPSLLIGAFMMLSEFFKALLAENNNSQAFITAIVDLINLAVILTIDSFVMTKFQGLL